jgi:hypothetical protein
MILFLFCFFLYLHHCVNFIIDVPRSVQPLTNAEDLVLFGNSIYPCNLTLGHLSINVNTQAKRTRPGLNFSRGYAVIQITNDLHHKLQSTDNEPY